MPDLNDRIETEANRPLTSSTSQQSTTGRSIGDLIAAAQHTAAVAASGLAHKGISHVQLIPAGAPSVGRGDPSGAFNQAGGL